MEEFFTRKTASKGVKLPLYLPNGEKSDQWLVVRGIDSDEFKDASIACQRKAVEISQTIDAKKDTLPVRELEAELASSLVSDWSFKTAPTMENIAKFFIEAPQILEAVNRYSANRANFFKPLVKGS